MQTFKEFKSIFGSPSDKKLKELDNTLKSTLSKFEYKSQIKNGQLSAYIEDNNIELRQFQQVVNQAMRSVNFFGSADFQQSARTEGYHVVVITPKK